MFASAQKTAASSLDALRRKVNLQHVLAGLQPLLLLQMLGGLSQAVSSGVSQTQALARTLLLSGQQRLRTLLAAAPRLRWLPERSPAPDSTPEEAAAQALLEVCLGLMLEWMARESRRPRFDASSLPVARQRISSVYLPSSSRLYPLKARLCITSF